MRNTRWLRYGLASLTIFGAGLSVFVVACGDEDSGTVPPGTSTSSSSSSSSGNTSSSSSSSSSGEPGPIDSGAKDATADAKPPPVEPAKLQLINGATDFGPAASNASGALRICYKIKSGATNIFAPLPPLPNRVRKNAAGAATQPFPGVFIGTGGSVDGTGTNLETFEVTPYVFSAQKLEEIGKGSTITAGQDKLCQELLEADAGGALTQNTDYWIFPPILAGELKAKKSYILLLSGCAGGSTLGTAKCGGDPGANPGLGNLKITKIEVDREAAPDANSLNAQFVNASPNLEGTYKATTGGEGVRPAITADPQDAGAAKPLNAGTDVVFLTVTPLVKVAGVNYASDKVVGNNKGPAGFAFGFPTIQALSGQPAYANGKSYTFIAVGDPTASPTVATSPFNPTGFNLRFLHILGLPNDPPVSTFDPLK